MLLYSCQLYLDSWLAVHGSRYTQSLTAERLSGFWQMKGLVRLQSWLFHFNPPEIGNISTHASLSWSGWFGAKLEYIMRSAVPTFLHCPCCRCPPIYQDLLLKSVMQINWVFTGIDKQKYYHGLRIFVVRLSVKWSLHNLIYTIFYIYMFLPFAVKIVCIVQPRLQSIRSSIIA